MSPEDYSDRKSRALVMIADQLDEAHRLYDENRSLASLEIQFERWRHETGIGLSLEVNQKEAKKFLAHEIEHAYESEEPLVKDYMYWATDHLSALSNSIYRNPQYYFERVAVPIQQAASSETVYIMYGNESTAVLLQKMIRDWEVEARLLKDDALGAATLIQKLQSALTRAAFVFVVLTEDDYVKDGKGKEYMQPRPNALIELGYYLGGLGQNKVAVLCTAEVRAIMPSNLQGIELGIYKNSLEEQTSFVQKQLKTVGLGPLAK